MFKFLKNYLIKFFLRQTKSGRKKLANRDDEKLKGKWMFSAEQEKGNTPVDAESTYLKALENPELEQVRQMANQNWTHL